MSDKTFEMWEDDSLDRLLHDAYEQIEPSEDAEQRMLAAILAEVGETAQDAASTTQAAPDEQAASVAQDAAVEQATPVAQTTPAEQTTPDDQAVSGAPARPPARVATPAPKRATRGGKWVRVAAAIVAVVVLVGAGVGVGMSVLSMNGANSTPVATGGPSQTGPSSTAQNGTAAENAKAQPESSSMYDMAPAEKATASTADGYAEDSMVFDPDAEGFSTEEYRRLTESRFVATATSPLSTVSADVDTASYCNVRRLISQRADVPSGAVRIEEMLNYFTYDYATPESDGQFATTVQVAQCPWNADTQLMVLGFATTAEAAHPAAGSNLVFLVDVSGSMNSRDKLDLLKDSFAVLTSQLDANDRVSIVTYAGNEELVLEGASGADARTIQRAIDKLKAHGSTNGEAGLKMAYEVAERNFIEGGVNRVIMASDGDLNVGITSESDLYDLVDAKRESGIYLSVLGFGSGNYKDNKMETLADHGNGNYHYIDCVAEAERVFGERLLANLVPFADDVKVQVEFNPSTVKAYRLIGYENRTLAAEDFRDDAVDAGDVGPNSQFTVAYEIVPAGSAFEVDVPELRYGSEGSASTSTEQGNASTSVNASELATCALRWRAFADGQVHEQATPVLAADVATNPSADWKMAAAVIEYGMLLRGSSHAGTASYDAVLDLLDDAGGAEGAPHAKERSGFRDLVERTAELVRAE